VIDLKNASNKRGLVVIIMRGLPGSGKTTSALVVARKLGEKGFQVEKIHSDELRKRLKVEHTFEGRLLVYDKMFEQAEENLHAGKTVILDATFSRVEMVMKAKQLAQKFNARFYCIECACATDEVAKRVSVKRDEKLFSNADLSILEKMKNDFEEAKIPENALFCLDTSVSLEEKERLIEEIVEKINR